MSLFDDDLATKSPREAIRASYDELLRAIEDVALSFPAEGAMIIETENPKEYIAHLERRVGQALSFIEDYSDVFDCLLNKSEISCFRSIERKLKGRKFIHWDVSTFRKYDAAGSMHNLSLRPAPKPVVVIENITHIPDGESEINDDPRMVEDQILHSWKDDVIHLTFKQQAFELHKSDCIVLFPIERGGLQRLYHRLPDGIPVFKTEE